MKIRKTTKEKLDKYYAQKHQSNTKGTQRDTASARTNK